MVYDDAAVAIRDFPSFGHPARLLVTAESGNSGVGLEIPAPVLFCIYVILHRQSTWIRRFSANQDRRIRRFSGRRAWRVPEGSARTPEMPGSLVSGRSSTRPTAPRLNLSTSLDGVLPVTTSATSPTHQLPVFWNFRFTDHRPPERGR